MPSVKACPYPVLPVGLIVATTHPSPALAKTAGFQRVLQLSVHAPCGPPWIRKASGYFFLGSKFVGSVRYPWILTLSNPGNQNSWIDCGRRGFEGHVVEILCRRCLCGARNSD